jgi:hypothetical protein
MIDILLAAASAAVAAGVLIIYLKNWRRVRTLLLVGPVAFASLIMVGNLLAAFVYLRLAQSYSADVAVPLLLVQASQFAGLVGLLWATTR